MGVRAPGKGECAAGEGRARAARCARSSRLKEHWAAARAQAAARRSHFASLARLLPAHLRGDFFQKWGLEYFHTHHTPSARVKGKRRKGILIGAA